MSADEGKPKEYLDVGRCSPGPWQYHDNHEEISDAKGVTVFDVMMAFSEDVMLATEASTVAHETGKGPRQLADELEESEKWRKAFIKDAENYKSGCEMLERTLEREREIAAKLLEACKVVINNSANSAHLCSLYDAIALAEGGAA